MEGEAAIDITFGIITDGTQDKRINQIINSIRDQDIANFEIIIVGNSKLHGNRIVVIPFNENGKKAWITKKKNLVTLNAKYENIVFMHDYFAFDKNWYVNIRKIDCNFDVAMSRLILPSGERYRDWVLWNRNGVLLDYLLQSKNTLIPYSYSHLQDFMYISGGFWIAKKSVMEEFPLDEELYALEGEDVEWSCRVRSRFSFVMCEESIVHLLKINPVVFKPPGFLVLRILRLARFTLIRKILMRKRRELPYNLYDFLMNVFRNLPSLITFRVLKIINHHFLKRFYEN